MIKLLLTSWNVPFIAARWSGATVPTWLVGSWQRHAVHVKLNCDLLLRNDMDIQIVLWILSELTCLRSVLENIIIKLKKIYKSVRIFSTQQWNTNSVVFCFCKMIFFKSNCEQYGLILLWTGLILLWTGLTSKGTKIFLLIGHSLVIIKRTGHNHGGEGCKWFRTCKTARSGCRWNPFHRKWGGTVICFTILIINY